jgi:hypothetical protein
LLSVAFLLPHGPWGLFGYWLLPQLSAKRLAVDDDIVGRLRERQKEVEEWWPHGEEPLTLVGEAADEIERLREELNTIQELLARCYKLAVGHGPNFDVFDDWEEAVSAYERETYRDNP